MICRKSLASLAIGFPAFCALVAVGTWGWNLVYSHAAVDAAQGVVRTAVAVEDARSEDRNPISHPAQSPDTRMSQIAASFGRIPLSFEANAGQMDKSVKFLSRGDSYSLFLTDSAAVLSLARHENPADSYSRPERFRPQDHSASDLKTDSVRMELAGANPDVRIAGTDRLPGIANYFIGNDPSHWQSNIPTYARVRYTDVYPGVDLVFYGNQRQLEYDFVLAPHADPSPIRLHFDGAGKLAISPAGDLTVATKCGDIAFHKPVVYQQVGGSRQLIPGRFTLLADRTASFKIGSYDHSQPLVIDPTLVYSTYLGGSGFTGDSGSGIAVDTEGNAYIVGSTNSADFPVTQGAFQTTDPAAQSHSDLVFVTKLNAAGTALAYSTYIGGTWGDTGTAIALDDSGDAYVTGYTESPNFPVTTGAYQTTDIGATHSVTNAFVTELNPTGTALVYSTFLGGTGALSIYGDEAYAIAVDDSGDAYVAGQTYSTDFPVTTGAYQTANNGAAHNNSNAFLTKLNPAGSALVFSTYLGGSGNILLGGDTADALAVDGSGNAYLAGSTYSADFPVTTGASQTTNKAAANNDDNAFVAKLSSDGSALIYSTFLGGNGFAEYGDEAYALAIDASGDVYVAGKAWSTNFPVTKGAYQTTQNAISTGAPNAFISKLNPSGSALLYSTYLGGSLSGQANALGVDGNGNAYVTGQTYTSGFPVTSNAYQASNPATAQIPFVTVLNAAGSGLAYSTFLGGAGTDLAYGLATDGLGNVTITGQAGSANFPVTTGAFQSTNRAFDNAGTNVFVSKLNIGVLATKTPTATTLVASANPQTKGRTVTFTATVSAQTGTTVPTGSVAFSVNGTTVTTVSLNLEGKAAYSTATLSAGVHTLKAVYEGSSSFTSSSASLAETITEPRAATPIFSPTGRTYDESKLVILSDATSGAAIYYTTSGKSPTTASTLYRGAIKVTRTTTIKAIAVAPGYADSTVASATYTIILPAPTPTFSPATGTVASGTIVRIADKATKGLVVHYTTNGKTPTTSSTIYTPAGIKVSATETIEAIAIAAGYSQSAVASAKYTVKQ
jgi:hypothetical protein